MIDPRHPPAIWAHRYSNGVVGARDRAEPYSSLSHGDPFVKYVRADLGSFYQEKYIDALMACRDALRQIVDLGGAYGSRAWMAEADRIAREALANTESREGD